MADDRFCLFFRAGFSKGNIVIGSMIGSHVNHRLHVQLLELEITIVVSVEA